MTTINTTDDLLRLLREDTDFYEQARRLILTDELINLPERFAAFAARVDKFIADQEQFNDEQRQFNDEQRQLNDRVIARLDRIEGDLSYFKNRFSESQVGQEAATIAMAMGFTLERVVGNVDLVQLCQHPDARHLPQGDLISFTRADLVIEVSDEDGDHQFIAVEISYTADQRDTTRAQRNASYLTRLTGQPAHAAVASARNDHETQGLIDAGTIWWYPLADQTDGAES